LPLSEEQKAALHRMTNDTYGSNIKSSSSIPGQEQDQVVKAENRHLAGAADAAGNVDGKGKFQWKGSVNKKKQQQPQLGGGSARKGARRTGPTSAAATAKAEAAAALGASTALESTETSPGQQLQWEFTDHSGG